MHDEFNSLVQVQGQMVSADRTSWRQLHTWVGILSYFVVLSVCVPAKWTKWSKNTSQTERKCLAGEANSSSSAFRVQLWSGHLDTVILMLSEVWCGNCRQWKWSVSNKMKSRQSAKDSRTDLCYQPKAAYGDAPQNVRLQAIIRK